MGIFSPHLSGGEGGSPKTESLGRAVDLRVGGAGDRMGSPRRVLSLAWNSFCRLMPLPWQGAGIWEGTVGRVAPPGLDIYIST